MEGPGLRRFAVAIASVRLVAGVALGAFPRRFLRWEPPAAGSAMPLTLRTVGIRDLAVGLGTATAVRHGDADDLERWLWAGTVSDALDVVAGFAAARSIGHRGVVSAAMALPMVVADAAALTMLRRSTPGSMSLAMPLPEVRRRRRSSPR
jgi:hypothetical protein